MGVRSSQRYKSLKGLSSKELARLTDELLEKHGSHELVLRKAFAQDKRIISTPMGNSTR